MRPAFSISLMKEQLIITNKLPSLFWKIKSIFYIGWVSEFSSLGEKRDKSMVLALAAHILKMEWNEENGKVSKKYCLTLWDTFSLLLVRV